MFTYYNQIILLNSATRKLLQRQKDKLSFNEFVSLYYGIYYMVSKTGDTFMTVSPVTGSFT